MHFELDMLDEVHDAGAISVVDVDSYFQMQVRDKELRECVISHLPDSVQSRFDLTTNHKPWVYLRRHDYRQSGIKLDLSQLGLKHLQQCFDWNQIDRSIFGRKLTVGFLWRYRTPGGAISVMGQRDRVKLLAEISQLMNKLIKQHDAHILVCGMDRATGADDAEELMRSREAGGVVAGEIKDKFAKEKLSIPDANCTYLKGLGFASEMEIMAQCDLLLLMPSGFSEPLWMRKDVKVVMVAPPPNYMLRLLWNRMPFYDNYHFRALFYNIFMSHSPEAAWRYLSREGFIEIRKQEGLIRS